MIPSCDHMGVPIHFHSSTTSGSASLMSLRILLKVSPRQSPSSAILLSISSDGDLPSVELDLFMLSSFLILRECLRTTHSRVVTSPRRQRHPRAAQRAEAAQMEVDPHYFRFLAPPDA